MILCDPVEVVLVRVARALLLPVVRVAALGARVEARVSLLALPLQPVLDVAIALRHERLRRRWRAGCCASARVRAGATRRGATALPTRRLTCAALPAHLPTACRRNRRTSYHHNRLLPASGKEPMARSIARGRRSIEFCALSRSGGCQLQRISGRGLGSGAPADAAKMDYLSYLYTPQQMSGGASFGHATRVGNWSEDYELQQHRIKCAHGGFVINYKRALAPVPKSPGSELLLDVEQLLFQLGLALLELEAVSNNLGLRWRRRAQH